VSGPPAAQSGAEPRAAAERGPGRLPRHAALSANACWPGAPIVAACAGQTRIGPALVAEALRPAIGSRRALCQRRRLELLHPGFWRRGCVDQPWLPGLARVRHPGNVVEPYLLQTGFLLAPPVSWTTPAARPHLGWPERPDGCAGLAATPSWLSQLLSGPERQAARAARRQHSVWIGCWSRPQRLLRLVATGNVQLALGRPEAAYRPIRPKSDGAEPGSLDPHSQPRIARGLGRGN